MSRNRHLYLRPKTVVSQISPPTRKLNEFLFTGRRGVFDGTVENMHLHWKYRELVKILSGETNIDELYSAARTYEAESGGILVATERVRKGHTTIVYPANN